MGISPVKISRSSSKKSLKSTLTKTMGMLHLSPMRREKKKQKSDSRKKTLQNLLLKSGQEQKTSKSTKLRLRYWRGKRKTSSWLIQFVISKIVETKTRDTKERLVRSTIVEAKEADVRIMF